MSKGFVARGKDGGVTPNNGGDAPVGQASLPDQVTPDPNNIRSERPGPKPSAVPAPAPNGRINETYLASRGPDAIDVNERKWSAKKAALREAALAEAAKLPKPDSHQPLFGTKLDAPEGDEPSQAVTPDEQADEEQKPSEEERKAAELQEIAKRDRENRRLRKELKTLEAKGASAAKKEAWLQEQAKKNPRGVMALLGIADQAALEAIRDHGDKPAEVPKWEEPQEPAPDEEKETLRKERDALQMQVAQQNTRNAIAGMVQADGSSRWPAAAAMGQKALDKAMTKAMDMAKDMKRSPTKQEALGVLELCLDEVNEEYAAIGKALGSGTGPKPKGKPQPRNPVTVPRGNPMDNRNPFRDESDPRNRPTWREIGDRSRKKYFG